MADKTKEREIHFHSMADKTKEREIPVFTVVKNNCILKNIYLLDNPPSSPMTLEKSETEETLLVGRHPDCHIKLEHPSISRFHLRIHSKPASLSLYVTDMSSVHGSWISGKKVEPNVRTKLNEGDTLQLGGSSRLYRLHWVPYSRAYDTENPFVPQMDSDAVEEEIKEEPICQDENNFSSQNEQLQALSEENLCISVQKLSPSTPLRSKDLYDSFSDEEASENVSSPGDIYNQENETASIKSCHFEEEDIPPQALSSVSGLQTESQIESLEMESEKNSNLSIWSRRGKCKSVKIETSQSSAKSVRIDSDVKSMVHETYETELNLENLFASPDHVHVFTPDKENLCPVTPCTGSVKKKTREALKSVSILNNTSVSSLDLDDDVLTPDKENMTPNTYLLRLTGNLDEVKHAKSYKSSPSKKSFNSNMHEDGFLVLPLSRNENQNGNVTFDDDDDDEVFTPDKENMTPNTRLLRIMGKLDEVKHEKSYKSSPLKKSGNSNMHEDGFLVLPVSRNDYQYGNVLQERRSTISASKSRYASLKKEETAIKKNAEREPFRPLSINKSDSKAKSQPSIHITSKTSESFNYPDSEEVLNLHKNITREENKTWYIIVDSSCLLNKKSRNELQLLRGLKGTSLIVPRIVVRELDCMLKRGSWFRRTTEVSEALDWIEDCMKNTKWWIHVQNSAEEGILIPPTPPASAANWFNEDKSAFKIGSIPFSPYSLQEIVTPTAEDHILEYTLSLKRTRNDGQPVILSNDVTLKIKAMAEGVICETVEEYRSSLVNPFSERFLYIGSSPRGATWSCDDDAVLKEKYYPCPSKKLSKSGGGVKGLKLILQHNSKFQANRNS